jgi:hypothetical protein
MAWYTTVDSHVSHDVEHDQNMMYMPEHDIDEAHVSEHDVYAPPIPHEDTMGRFDALAAIAYKRASSSRT